MSGLVAEVAAKLTADTSDFRRKFESAARTASTLRDRLTGMSGQNLTLDNSDFVRETGEAQRKLDALQRDASMPINLHGSAHDLWQDSSGRWRNAVGQYASGAEKAAAGVDKIGKAAERSAGKTAMMSGVIGGAVGGVVSAGAMMAAGGIQEFGTQAVTTAADFESAMSQMKQAAGASGADMEALSDLAMQMGADTIFSAQEAAGAMVELAKGGMTPAQIQAGGLKSTLSLAAASGMDMATSAVVMNSAMHTFGLSATDSQQAVDALAGAANASSADVSDLAQGLSQTGQAASNAGLTVQDTTAVLAAFADAGVKGSDAGTSFKTFLQNMVPQSDAAKNAMHKLGLSFFDAQGKMRPIGQIAEQLKTKLGKMSTEQRTAALNTIFGADASRAASILTKQGAKGLEQYIAATSKSGTASEAATARMGPMATAFEQIKGSIETLQLTLGQALAPAITAIAQALIPLVNQLSGPLTALGASLGGMLSQVFGAIAPMLGPLMTAVAALAQVFGGVLSTAVSALVPVITPLLGIFTTLGQSVAPILMPVLQSIGRLLSSILGAVMPLLAPLTTLMIDILGTAGPIIGVVADLLSEFVGALTPVFAAVGPLLPVLGQLVRMLGTILTPILRALVPVVGAVVNVFTNVMVRSLGPVISVIGGLIFAFSKVYPVVLNYFAIPIADAFLWMASTIVDAAASAFSWVPGLGDKLQDAKTAVETFKTTASDALKNASSTIATEGESIGTSMMNMGADMLLNGPPQAAAAGAAMGTGFVAGMQGAVGAAAAAGTAVGTSAGTGLARTAHMSADAADRFTQTFASGLNSTAGVSADAAERLSGAAVSQIAQSIGPARQAATEVGAAVVTGVQSSTAAATAAGTALGTGAVNGTQSAVGEANSAGTQVGNALADGLQNTIQSRAEGVAAAAYAMGKQAAQAVQAGAEVNSPSRITIEAGHGIVDGVVEGIGARSSRALSVAARFGAMVAQRTAVATGVAMQRARNRVVTEARFNVADAKDAVADARKAVKDAKNATERARAHRELTRALWAQADAEAAARRAGADFDQQFKTAALDAAREKLDALKDKAKNAIDAMLDFGKVTTLQTSNGVQPMAGAIVANMQQRLAAIKSFGGNLKKLRALGLNDAAIQDIIAQGPLAGNKYAEALLADTSSIAQINSLRAEMISAAGGIGDVAALSSMNADNPYAGSAVANSTVNVTDGAVVINFAGSVSAADRNAIKADINKSVRDALRELALEIQRGGR